MGCEVYANCDEIACKAGDGKVIAAFPDVCLTPPSPPAGPIPVPYPDTSFSKDMQNGSKTVKIKNQPIMLKDQSFYKTSPLGDEAATRGLGAGVITHVITGKTYFVMWSMDVKVEGKNVDRHLDLTTSNHMSLPPNEGVPMGNLSMMAAPAISQEERCKQLHDEKERICGSVQKVQVPKDPEKWLKKKSEKQREALCAQLRARIQGLEDCLAARQRVTDECFGGVTDARHAEQERQVRNALREARQAASDFGC
jgi:Toxin PAAR-like domain